MKFFTSALIAAIALFLLTPASASILAFEDSISSIKSASFICEKEEKEKKKGKKDKKAGDEEPDCD